MSKKGLSVNIRPLGFLDLLAFKKLIPARKERIADASAQPVRAVQPVNALAARLHPERQHMVVSDVVEQTSNARTYRLVCDPDSATKELAVFRPGQYLSFFFELEGATVTRPYSICSSAAEALEGYYEITVKRNREGYISQYIWDNWKLGTKVVSGSPQGQFYHESLRDSCAVVGLAGGCGVTPFRSMAKGILDGSLNISLTLIYGSNTMDEVIFLREFREMEVASGGRIKVVRVLSGEESEGCEAGFITAELIRRHCDPARSSFFICGPQQMYVFLQKEIEALGLPRKRVRWEHFGEIRNVISLPGYPIGQEDRSFGARVHMGAASYAIPALAGESLLVAMERAGLNPPSGCRSGACGLCRSLLIRGDVFIPEDEDGRRAADKQFGFIHPCGAFPLGDVEIVIPRAKV